MADKHRVDVPGSGRAAAPQAREIGPVAAEEHIQVTMVLRRRAAVDAEVVAAGGLSAEEVGRRFGAAPEDIEAVRRVVTDAGADVVEVDAASRRGRIEAPTDVGAALFGAPLPPVASRGPPRRGMVAPPPPGGPPPHPARPEGGGAAGG